MNSMHSVSRTTMDPAEVERQRYMHHMQRRSMPPRCNPISIVVMVLALGMLFIGLTMTVIAHWPGNSSIGENPLKIAGPVLLAAGALVFIVGMIWVCFWQSKEKEQWQNSMKQLAQSRSQMYLHGNGPHDSKLGPGPGILKEPSVSSYKGSDFGGQGYNTNAYPYGYPGGEHESDNNSMGQHEVFKIDTVPDPRQRGYPGQGPLEQSSMDYGEQVPQPVRQVTKKKPRGSENTGYAADESPKREVDGRQMKSYPAGEGYDMYQGQGEGQGQGQKPVKKPRHRKRKDGEEGVDKPRVHHHHHDDHPSRTSSHSNEGYEPDRSQSTSYPASYYANVPGGGAQQPYSPDASASPTVYTGAGLTSPLSGSGMGGLAGAGGMGMTPGMEQQLKINIRAQPNTAVHITPGVHRTPPQPPHPQPIQPYNRQANMSQSSIETEI